MVHTLLSVIKPNARLGALAWVVSIAAMISGCSSTAEQVKIRIGSPNTPKVATTNLIVDSRPSESRIYSQDGKTQYLGDGNFNSPPVEVIATRFKESLGSLLDGQEISLLAFQARITSPGFQSYPGMPLASEILGRGLGLPQLGYPHYANVSLRGVVQQQEFSGGKSVQFYLGTGEAEVAEAFEAAVSEAANNLKKLLKNGSLTP